LTEQAARQPTAERASAYSRDRIITLSDGVFAIAITLLVLDVVPKIPSEITGADLARELLAFWPKLGYGLAVPAAFVAPYAALALVLLTTTLARWAAQRVLIVQVERS
jgi:hypothetical protein